MKRLFLHFTWAIAFAASLSAQDFEKLSRELSSGDREVRREAAFQLRELGAEALPALPALINALQDDDEQVAGRAVTSIARIGPEASEAIPALIESMDPDRRRYDEQVVYRTAFALGEIGEASVEPLRKALKSSSDRRRSGAAQALQLLGVVAAPAVPELINALHDEESEVRRPAAEALAAIGEPALAALQRDLAESPSPAAVHAIGLMGAPGLPASDQLFALLGVEKSDEFLREATLIALGALKVPFEKLATPIRDGLVDESERVQRAAASAIISSLPGDHGLRALKAWLRDDDATLRARAAWAAGQFGTDGGSLAPDLIARLKAGDDRDILTEALEGLGASATAAVLDEAAHISLEELGESEHWARKILRASGPLAMPELENGLAGEAASTRYVALDALAEQGRIARHLEPSFRKASNDPAPAVRLAALLALEATGAELGRLVTILRRRCADDSGEVRAVAVRLLGGNAGGDPSLFGIINAALDDSEPSVRLAAIGALASYGSEATEAISKLLKLAEGADTPTTLAILQALSPMGETATAALPIVRRALKSPSAEVRGAAISALVAIEPDGDSLTEVLSEMLQDEDKAVRHPAIVGLGEVGEAAVSAAPKLFALLDNGDDREEVLEALRRIRSSDVDLYLTALDNRDPKVRLFACEALGRLGSEAERAIPKLEKMKRDRYDFVRRRAEDAIARIRG